MVIIPRVRWDDRKEYALECDYCHRRHTGPLVVTNIEAMTFTDIGEFLRGAASWNGWDVVHGLDRCDLCRPGERAVI